MSTAWRPSPATSTGGPTRQSGPGVRLDRERRRRGHPRPARHDHPRPRPRHVLRDLAPGDSVIVAAGGQGGHGNTHFKSSTNRRPAAVENAAAGRGAVDHAGAEGHRRRRPGRPAERGQVDPAVADLAGPSRDRRLPVHDQVPEPGHGRRPATIVVRRGRHPRPDRGGARGPAWARVPPPRRARPTCWSTWSSRAPDQSDPLELSADPRRAEATTRR